jgi:hypothetical protein
MTWQIVTIANLGIAAAYFGISFFIFSGLLSTDQMWSNRLATATGLIFFTCAVHHGTHAFHMLIPSLGIHDAKALALRDAWHWETAVWDLFSVGVAFYYLSLRGSYGSVLRGAQMFEDFKVRERQALEINDNIVQGLAVAKLSLETGSDEEGRRAVEDTLRRAQGLITELLGTDDADFDTGKLRRSTGSDVLLEEEPAT